MAVIGLLGDEYDSCVGILKARIEDEGHTARIINLRHLPRVTRATIDGRRIVCDGYDLLEMDCFYLREMGARDPFFHVTYTKELWGMLFERYLAFAAAEGENVNYALSLLEVLALRKPVINPPKVYAYRRLMPFQLNDLASKGFAVPPFSTGAGDDGPAAGIADEMPLDLEEKATYDVLSFPKGNKTGVHIRRSRIDGRSFTVFVTGDGVIDAALSAPEPSARPARIALAELPRGVAETARRAAAAIEARFARVDLCAPSRGGAVWLLQVDPSPDFYEIETEYKLLISKPLASYLVNVARRSSS